jgi:WD40 repeat protein
MGVDLEKKRLFVAATGNNTLEVVDLTGGKVLKSLAGFKDTQDALFLGGDFNKLYVSSLDGHVRVFQGETFWLVHDFKVEPDPIAFSMTRLPISSILATAARMRDSTRTAASVFCRRSPARDTTSLSRI